MSVRQLIATPLQETHLRDVLRKEQECRGLSRAAFSRLLVRTNLVGDFLKGERLTRTTLERIELGFKALGEPKSPFALLGPAESLDTISSSPPEAESPQDSHRPGTQPAQCHLCAIMVLLLQLLSPHVVSTLSESGIHIGTGSLTSPSWSNDTCP